MICPKCRTVNDDSFQFCQECGVNFQDDKFVTNKSLSDLDPKTLALPASAINLETQKDIPATQYITTPPNRTPPNLTPPNSGHSYPSEDFPTIVKQPEFHVNNNTGNNQPIRRSSKIPLILLGLLSVGLLGVVGYLVIPPLLKKTIVPDHFGLFTKKNDQLSELRQREYTNVLKGRDELKDDASLPITDSNPNLILYSDGQTIPSADLKLIKLDSIKEDGKIENWEYQVAPVDENSQMKQIKVNSGLPKGKYALALFKGNFDEGTHKIWAFQVENGASSPAASQLIALTLKPTPTPTPTPQIVTKTVTPTPEDTPDESEEETETGICNENNVVVRSSPVISESNKIGRLDRGQKVVILRYSSESETWNGVTARWIYVRTPKGKTGWVFGAFIN